MKKILRPILQISLILIIFLIILFSLFASKELKRINSLFPLDEVFLKNTALNLAIIRVESNFNESAISKKGAVGLMQLLPSTAKYLEDEHDLEKGDLFDGKTNIKYGSYYLSHLKDFFQSEELAIIAYNAGEGNVRKWRKTYGTTEEVLKNIPFKETRDYIKKVTFYKSIYQLLLNFTKITKT